ncbi:TlpA disulfide reductase family protein [Novilysobacter defluvii]|uniref:Redoxin n=1 Tax=Lysobacter defluvii IMMIB APB-9 = DSM 18482 TaxID=1385515 RepID=A0A0A0M895_9GAMM|nr:TlpA disulfide reductase family protein [Lysobacter defluvii]KGO99243.1 redoxin [Lysobacter defluvii IMMIB APB-9 = DSM 18482]
MLGLGPVPMTLVILLLALGVAALVGRWAAKRPEGPRVPVAGLFFDMLLVGLVAGRLVFVVQWWPQYAADPWSLLRFGDGGYSIWAAVLAGLAFAAWRARRTVELRKPLLWGTGAGLAVGGVLTGALLLMQQAVVRLPDVELTRLEGGPVQLSDMGDQPKVVNLWATWCPPCRREMPVLADSQATNPHVTFVFANQGEGGDLIREYLDGAGLELDNVVLDPFSSVSQATGARGLPVTLFFEGDGRLVDVHMGELTSGSLARKLQRFGPTPLGGTPLSNEAMQ